MDLHFGVFSDNPYTRRIILEGISIISNYPNDVDNNLRDVNLFINNIEYFISILLFFKIHLFCHRVTMVEEPRSLDICIIFVTNSES